MDELFKGLTIEDYHGDIYRNIVSLRVSEDLFDDLSDNPDAWQAAIDLELASKPHTHSSSQPIIARPFEEADYNQAIHYPFQQWASSRYSNGAFGVWYGADTLKTSVYETAYHWYRQLLQDSGWHEMDGIEIERKVYLVRCEAALLDFRKKVDDHPALIDPDSYHLTHQVGARIHHDGHPGLASRSARCEGDIFAVFNQRVLFDPRHHCYLTYSVGNGEIIIKRNPDETLLSIPI